MARRRSRATKSPPARVGWVPIGMAVAGALLLGRGSLPSCAPSVVEAEPASDNAPVLGPLADATVEVSVGPVAIDREAPPESETTSSSAVCPRCDVVVIVVESLRRDHVGVYGEHQGLTPAMDSVAKGGFRFERAYASSNYTMADFSTLLTGRFGSKTGVTGSDRGVPRDVRTLAEVLGHYGYITAAFSVDAPSGFRPGSGLDRGFQHMDVVAPPRDTPEGRHAEGALDAGGATAAPMVQWLEKTSTDKPIFAVFHTRSAHFPFVVSDKDADPTGILSLLWAAGTAVPKPVPAPVAATGEAADAPVDVQKVSADPLGELVASGGDAAVAALRQAYAAAVSRADIDVARVLEAIEKRGRKDKTMVVLVADHGEPLFDHGELRQGDAYFDSVVNVPLVMRIPGLSGRTKPISALVSQADVLPTVLDALGAVPPADIDGASMIPLMRGTLTAIRTTTVVESDVGKQPTALACGAVISLPYTLLRQQRGCDRAHSALLRTGQPAVCLFDITTDAAQQTDIAAEHGDVAHDLFGRWDEFRSMKAPGGDQLDMDPAKVEVMQRIGYDFRTQ